MWSLVPCDEFKRKQSKWPKKYHRELAAVLKHVQILLDALNDGAKVENLRFGFVHNEPCGVIAVDQKGGGPGLMATRLYLFLDKDKKEMNLITLGNKDSQASDIKFCTEFVKSLMAQ